MHPIRSHQRQVHLDFHTSPYIGDVGCEFEAGEFAETFRRARVNSVTIFAKCHHGMSYYPTKVGTPHPALGGRDLLGEQIEALHRAGIRCPIYTTVAFEEDVARRFPEWRQMRTDGTFARAENADAGGWWYNNFLHPDYQDYMEAHVEEVLKNYEVDGFFFDILFFDPLACWSAESRKFRERHNLRDGSHATQARFESRAQEEFAERFTRLVKSANKHATVFYNSTNPIFSDACQGVRSRHEQQSHWELESLPSGFWGYFHFPRMARAIGNWGKPWLGMTGRFQKAWGDFGGVKPQAALEYECFRSQALGGANSVGDQLPPRGRLDQGAYDVIGAVFAQCEAAEAFYGESESFPQVGILAGNPGEDPGNTDRSLEGAVQMCEEAHYDAIVLDDAGSFERLDMLMLPDNVLMTERLREKLIGYLNEGGKLILSQQSGFEPDGGHALGLPLRRVGTAEKYPTYWRAKESFHPVLARSERVVYLAGENVEAAGCEVVVERVLPYFKRTDLTFSSHLQTPPQSEADRFPAVVRGANFFYFADPIFREYRQSGNTAVRDGWREAMNSLIGAAPFGAGLPGTILSVPRRRGEDLLISLLHYIPTRKSLDIDMIEERSSFAGEILRLPAKAGMVRVFGSHKELEKIAEGVFLLPAAKGRLLLEVPGYFATKSQQPSPLPS